MKKLMIPWICLMVIAEVSFASQNVAAVSGIENYREGHYFKAIDAFSKQSKFNALESYYLGMINLYGYGQLRNNDKALRSFTQSAEGGYLQSQLIMGLYSLLEKKDAESAFYWFKKASDINNNMQAQMFCAGAYLFGYGAPKNEDKARQYYIAAAKQGNSIAQYTLAKNFLDTRHGGNNTLGLIWLNKAVLQQDPYAELYLAKLLIEGKAVPKDLPRALSLIDKALQKELPEAMVLKGDLALAQHDFTGAKEWYTKAINLKYYPANMALAKLYMDDKSPIHDAHEGYLLISSAAENNFPEAQLALAAMYKEGKVIPVNLQLANDWETKAKKSKQAPSEQLVINWLSNGKGTDFNSSGYYLKGIFTDWQNKEALRENIYNPSPQMVPLTRETIFTPQFILTEPNEITIGEFYDVLASSQKKSEKDSLKFSSYPLDAKLIQIRRLMGSPSAEDKQNLHQMIAQLKFAASLGDSEAEFDLGQVYQLGFGVAPNLQEAIRNYELAAMQENLPAMYNLGILYFEGHKTMSADQTKGLSYLQKAAFKGNGYAQFALATIYEHGLPVANKKMEVQTDPQQSEGMYYLAAADNNGAAQYQLAEHLVRKKQDNVSENAKQARQKMIKSLYEGAFANGVSEAILPLAFFNAMDPDKVKQNAAFKVAQQEIQMGTHKEKAALLLGLMYDRGIGVETSPNEALRWYAQSGDNPVSNFILGTYYSLGKVSGQDKQQGQALLQKAADEDFSYANLNVAVLNQKQEKEFVPNLERALNAGNTKAGLLLADYYLSIAADLGQMKHGRDIYQALATKGDKDAQLKLAYMSETGLGGKVDYDNAIYWFNQSAEQGQSIASYLLGRLYQMGYSSIQPDYVLAKQWYQRASDNPDASNALGFIFETVDEDYKNAEQAYAKAAGSKNKYALYNLGLIYEEGKGTAVDIAKAKKYYEEAVKQGHTNAMVRLAGLDFNRIDGSGDRSLALELYTKAAAKGDRDAFYQLGLLYESGVVGSVEYPKAIGYYEQAARLGNQQGMLALARMYKFGIGTPVDLKQAVEYYEKLAALGNGFAQYQLAKLYNDKVLTEPKVGLGKKWLEEAVKNGSLQANLQLQMLSSKNNMDVSYVEPIHSNLPSVPEKRAAELMYMDALNQWNCGNEKQAKKMLDQIHQQFPNYLPMKKIYDQIGAWCVS